MKKNLIYLLMAFLFVCCKSQKIDKQDIAGAFYKFSKKRNFSTSYNLELNSDGTFILTEKHGEGNPQCVGQWEIEDDKLIVLKCEKVKDVTEFLTNSYLSKRDCKLIIINKNKIRYSENIVLKRK